MVGLTQLISGLLAGAVATSPPTTTASTQPPRPLAASIPAQAMAVYVNRPSARAQDQARATAQVASILLAADALGVLPAEGQLLADVAACLPVIGVHDHAVVLLDISSHPIRPQAYQLEQLKLALLVRTGGQNNQLVAQIRRILSRYTNNQVAKLDQASVGADTFQRLADSRLPDWAVVTFGPLDDLYVVALGDSAHEQILAAHRGSIPALAGDRWFAQAHRRTGGPDATIEWLIDFERIRARLGEVVRGRPEAVLNELGFAHVRRGLWSIRQTGGALAWFGMTSGPDGDQLIAISDAANFPAEHRRAVPPGAGHAMVRVDVPHVAQTLARAYLAGRSPEAAARLRHAAEQLQEDLKVDLLADLLEHLGPYVIIHDWPEHPLHIPLACTVLIEVRNRERVEAALNALLAAWDAHWVQQMQGPGEPLMAPRVRRDQDGVWYLQAGLLGPALAVTHRYVVVSWSPQAVRANLKFLASQSPALPTQNSP